MTTQRLVLGVDPGVTGAIALLADGKFAGVIDLPMRLRRTGKQELDGYLLGGQLRGILLQHPGARVVAVLEDVSAMPPKRARDAKPCGACGHVKEAGMGVTSAFQFGRGAGGVQTALEVMGIAVHLVQAQKWKRDTGLTGTEKDYARTIAVQCYPAASDYLKRVKDGGRADALLMARWGDRNQLATQPTPKQPSAPAADLFAP